MYLSDDDVKELFRCAERLTTAAQALPDDHPAKSEAVMSGLRAQHMLQMGERPTVVRVAAPIEPERLAAIRIAWERLMRDQPAAYRPMHIEVDLRDAVLDDDFPGFADGPASVHLEHTAEGERVRSKIVRYERASMLDGAHAALVALPIVRDFIEKENRLRDVLHTLKHAGAHIEASFFESAEVQGLLCEIAKAAEGQRGTPLMQLTGLAGEFLKGVGAFPSKTCTGEMVDGETRVVFDCDYGHREDATSIAVWRRENGEAKLIGSFTIDALKAAAGDALDEIGRLLDIPRVEGADDYAYRSALLHSIVRSV